MYTVFLIQFYLCMFLPSGKILIIGGSIANFTNVAATFKVSTIQNYQQMPTVINPKPFSPVQCCAEADSASFPGVPVMMGQGKHWAAELTCPVCLF